MIKHDKNLIFFEFFFKESFGFGKESFSPLLIPTLDLGLDTETWFLLYTTKRAIILFGQILANQAIVSSSLDLEKKNL